MDNWTLPDENISQSQMEGDTGELASSAVYQAIGISMSVLFILALSENISVLYVYHRTEKLHTQTNYWIVSVIVCDLLIVINAFPLVIISSFAEGFPLGEAGCKWDGFIITLLGTSSILLLTGLSVQRYTIIFHTGKRTRIRKSRVFLAVIFCFVLGLFWAVVPLVGWGSYAPEGLQISCAPNWKSQTISNQSYTLCLFIFVLFIPCILLAFCYLRILYKVWYERRIQSEWIRTRRVKRDVKVTLSVALTLGSFLLSWTPYAVVSLCESFFHIDVYKISWMLVQLPCLMAKTACMWNPLVYVCHNQDFKKAFLDTFRCHKNKYMCRSLVVVGSNVAQKSSGAEGDTSTV